MEQAIVICTATGREDRLKYTLDLLGGVSWPVYVVINHSDQPDTSRVLHNAHDGFELGAIKKIYDTTTIDEFIFLQDGIHIKDASIFDKAFNELAGKSCLFAIDFSNYMLKYRREILAKMNIPVITTKEGSVYYESFFNIAYASLEKPENMEPLLPSVSVEWEYKWEITRMKVQNPYFIKWKGTWSDKGLDFSAIDKSFDLVVH